jgi:hypothetical protein
MRSSSREEVVEVLDALEAGYKRALDLTFDVLTTPERLRVLQRWEQLRRWQPAVEHALINQLAEQADPTELGGTLAAALANRLRITRAEASRRIHDAADLGERTALNGEPLQPLLPATAAAQRNGEIGAGHVAVIRGFVHRLPDVVDPETRAHAEAQLARLSVSGPATAARAAARGRSPSAIRRPAAMSTRVEATSRRPAVSRRRIAWPNWTSSAAWSWLTPDSHAMTFSSTSP